MEQILSPQNFSSVPPHFSGEGLIVREAEISRGPARRYRRAKLRTLRHFVPARQTG
jgi:hypothetical protein